RMAPSSTIPAMPRSTAAVAIRLPMAAISSVPSMTITPTSPGFASSIISTESLVARPGAAYQILPGHELHVIAHRPVLAGDELDRVGYRCGIRALEAGNQRVAGGVGPLGRGKPHARGGG